LPADRSGVLVQELAVGSDVDGPLQAGDVLMAVDGRRIADDGTCQLGSARAPFTHFVDMKSVGQKVRFDVWRDGKAVTVDWTASRFGPWERWMRSETAPRYLVYAGLLFVPATLDYLEVQRLAGPQRATVVHEIRFRPWEPPPAVDHEAVLLVHVFSSPVNAGVGLSVPYVVERVNGRSIQNLADLARALEEGHPKHDVFELGPFHHLEAIDREQAHAARASILSNYGITNDKNL
jgi:hypothetical protein